MQEIVRDSDQVPQQAGRQEPVSGDEPSRTLAWLALLMLGGVFAVSVIYHPPPQDYFSICGFKNVTGLPCPGCGLTHSFCALGKGSLLSAIEWNVLGLPLFLLFLLTWVRAVLVLLNRRRFPLAFDAFCERVRVVRWMAYAFIVFGASRIVYLILLHPASFQGSPLGRLLARLFS